MPVLCAWCNVEIKEEPKDTVSHGLCERCEQKYFPKENEMTKEKKIRYYYSHHEGTCEKCGHQVAADSEEQLRNEVCPEDGDLHDFSSIDIITELKYDWTIFTGQIAL
jgi:hypothetical protein